MNVTIGPEFERRIAEKVDSGLYTSASEVIRDKLRKGVLALDRGETSHQSVMEVFEEVKTGYGKKS